MGQRLVENVAPGDAARGAQGQRSRTESAGTPWVQLDLLAACGPAPPAPVWDAPAARAYVASRRQRRVCLRCGEDDAGRLVFRRRSRTAQPIARLVQVPVSRARLADAIAGCDALCRRCVLRPVDPRMLRSRRPSFGWNGGERGDTARGPSKSRVFEQSGSNLRKDIPFRRFATECA
jgi:hypothetical protein